MAKKGSIIKKRKRKNSFLYATTFFIILIIAFFVFLQTINKEDGVIRGVYFQNIELGSLTKEEAKLEIEKLAEEYSSQEHLLQTKEQTYKYNTEETGAIIDIAATIEGAYSHGKNRSFMNNKITQAQALIFNKEIHLITKIDEEKFNLFSATRLASLEQESKNASLKYSSETEKFEIEEGQNEITINKEHLKKKLLQNIKSLSNETIKLTEETSAPFITNENIQSLKQKADKILEVGFIVKLEERQWTIPKPVLASWIKVAESEREKNNRLYFNQNQIEQYINNHYFFTATKKPENSKFIINASGAFEEIEQGEDGSLLDIQESAKSIIASLENNGSMAFLSLKPIFADISKENIENLEIATLMGYGESDFIGSPHSRIHNINTGTKRYQGIILAPNEEFSFNELLGTIDAENGYLPASVIKNKKIVQEYGGGICQISTTLFRAALNAGLKITKRSSHSYVIDYYGKPGSDATIYPPNPDLKFVNNTDSHILIQNRIEGTKLYFEIYGRDDGRKVIVEEPIAYDVQGNGAMKTYFTQIVKDKDDNIIEQQVFKSVYGPVKKNDEEKNPLE